MLLKSEDKRKKELCSFVNKEFERRSKERLPFELQWQLNTIFLNGNQRCGLNTASGTIEQYDLPDGMEAEVYNQIAPLAKTRKAHLNKIDYAMTVKPRASEADDVSKAKVSTLLLRYKQSDSEFEKFKDRLVDWCETLGTCYVLSWWDVGKGDRIGDIEQAEVDENGIIKAYTESVFSGDVSYGLLSPYEVFPESMYKQEIADQRTIITEQVLTAEDIYDLYGIEVDGKSIDTYSISPVDGAGGFGYVATVSSVTSKTVENAEKVITWFERPGRKYAHGRLIILIGDNLFHYGELPYDEIPIVACKSDEVSGQFYGKSFIENLIPLQRAYNGMLNTVHDYAKRVAISNLLVEEGSISDFNEFLQDAYTPGAPITYKTGYQPPMNMPPADFPPIIYNHLSAIVADMERTAGVSQMQVYGHQSGVTSGKAIENLAEIDNTRLSLTGDNLRDCIKDLSKIWLSIYKKHATGYRTLRIVGGNDAGDALIWNTEDINSYDVYFDAENELIRSTDAQAQSFMNALNTGLLTNGDGSISEEVKERGRQLLKVNISEFDVSVYELQRQRANRENKLVRSGIPPVIMELDDHALHINEHTKELLQSDYLARKEKMPDVYAQFERHIAEHKAVIDQRMANAQAQMMNQKGGI
jgi:hypothetical protein